MSRWGGAFGRRRGDRATTTGRTAPLGKGADEPTERLLVEDHDGLLLLRPASDETLEPVDVADLAHTLHSENGTVTIVATAPGGAADALWPRLSELLDTLSAEGTGSIRLVMAGAGDDRPERPALARRIADAWELVVEAPDGQVLVVPGGSVFVPPGGAGWWRFAPGEEPELLGPRTPAPDWQSGVRRVPARMTDGCVVDQIPAGLLIRPAEATASRPGDVFHAIPVDHRRPAVVVGVPWGEDVAASEVAELLITLPAAVRSQVRLAPGGRRDVLRLGQSVAWMLKSEVEVTTGLPLFTSERPLGSYGVRSVLVGADGAPVWVPFVDAAVCPPSADADHAPPPRLLHWAPPLEEIGGAENGVVVLSDRWLATATRAGLWVGPRDGAPPSNSVHPVSGDGPVIEIGRPGERLDSSLWPVLSRLLETLAPAVRERAALHVHATPLDGGRALRTLAADQGLRVIRFAKPPHSPRPAPRGETPVRPEATPAPHTPGPRPATTNGPAPSAHPKAAPTAAATAVPSPPHATGGNGPAAHPTPNPADPHRTAGTTADPGRSPATSALHRAPTSSTDTPAPRPEHGPTAPPTPAAAAAAGPGDAPASAVPVTGGDGPGSRPRHGPAPRREPNPAEPTGTPAAPGSPPATPTPHPAPTAVSNDPAPRPEHEPAAPPSVRPAEPGGQPPTAAAAAGPGAPPAVPTPPDAGNSTASRPEHEPAARPTPPDPAAPIDPHRTTGATASPVGAPAPYRAPVTGSNGPAPQPEREPAAPRIPYPKLTGPTAPHRTTGATANPVGAPATPAQPTGGNAPQPERDPAAPAAPHRTTGAAPAPASPPRRAEAGPRTAPREGDGEPTPAPGPTREPSPAGPPHRPTPTPTPTPTSSPAPNAAPQHPLPPVPVSPRHQSTEEERTSFRALADAAWERHSAAVNRALAGMPALRGAAQEAARADLIAVRMYLKNGEGPLDHRELTRSLRDGEPRLVPYAACLASGLGRLPSYRGAVLCGPGGAAGHGELRPGTVLRDPAPLSGLPLDAAGKDRIAGVGYAIWSITGRRVRQLLDSGEEIVFAPGTPFRVLDVRTEGGAPLVLLRQLPDMGTMSGVLEDADRTALERIQHALTDRTSPGPGEWPERCSGPVGEY
ncbi:hypothetical protein OG787_31900 [Streptomyces sp. NBC_00075]|uniref:hypothetical protein n=1 Tax=Streptomyces sp. NBC_00075 TaxID=2975641 RepID=UPI003254961A